MRIPAPVNLPLRIGDPNSAINSPAWFEWFQRLSDYYEAIAKYLDPDNVIFGKIEPTNPADGLLVYANGSDWDPGNGEGYYRAKSLGGGLISWEYASAISAVTYAPLSTFNEHSARHENGGADEISVLGLSGLLADAQTPLAHKTSHQNGGADELSIAGLSGEAADPQPPKAHGTAAHSGDIGVLTQITGRAYGNMYAYNLGPGGTTVTVTLADTWYEIGAGISGGVCSGFTFQNAKELKCVTPGTYLIVWSLSVESATANQEVEGTVMLNGTADTSFASHCELMTANRAQALCGNGIIALVADDLISLAVLNHTAGNNIVLDHINLSLHRVA